MNYYTMSFAKSKIKAIEEIEKIEDKLIKYLTLFYDKESKIIKAIMEKNDYFSEIILSDFAYKGSNISEKEFYILIENLYKKYLNLNAILKFEAISFTVTLKGTGTIADPYRAA